MKRRTGYRFLWVLAVLALSPGLAAEHRLVKVGAFNNVPVIFKDDKGEFKGLYVDLLTEIGRKEDITFDYVFGTWQEGLDRIKAGEVDMLTSVAYTTERSSYMDYCKNPLLTVWGELYSQKSSEIGGILELDGKKIGAMQGDINAKIFQDLISSFSIRCQIVEFLSYDDVFQAIASKKVDAGVAGVTFGSMKQRDYGLKATGVVFNPLNIYFTTAKGENGDLRILLDGYLDGWKREEYSFFSQARKKWFYGSVGSVAVVPTWLIVALLSLLAIALTAVGFIVLLKIRVDKATDTIVKREKRLRESEKRFDLAIEGTGAGIWDWDMVNDKVLYSRQWKGMLGYADDEVENSFSGWKKLWHPDDAERIEKAIADHLAGKSERYEVAHRLRHKNGDWRWIITRGDIVTDEGGKPVRWVGTNIDITDSKRAEEKIKSLLAEKDIVLKEVHHRIKNNMNTLRSLLSLQAGTLTEPSAVKALEDAGNRVGSMMVLYDSLYRSANFTEISIKEYFPSLINQIVFTFPNSGIVKVESDIADFMVGVTILQPLGIIVNELVTNIMKYAFRGRAAGLISVSASLNGSTARVIIQDDGNGMPEAVDFQNSTGFGLMLVGALTEQIGGSIRIERGKGTKIILEFQR
jgi:PAS domain S-box-containing protein